MSKAILISDHAKWCALMMNGDKTIEVRKNKGLYKAIQKLIDEYGYADIYVYCSKDEWLLYKNKTENKWDILKLIRGHKLLGSFNGKIVFKFRCYMVEEIICRPICGEWESYTKSLGYSEIARASCLANKEIVHYLKGKNGYAIHISDLEIFDKPKELSKFNKYGCKQYDNDVCEVYGERGHLYTNCFFSLTKAPQNFCYIEVGE